MSNKKYVATCVITGKSFTDKQAEMQITITKIGPVWMGLWGNEPLVFDANDLVLLPRSFIPWLKAMKFEINEKYFVPKNATFYVR